MRLRCSGPQASVRAIAASTASAVTLVAEPAQVAHEHGPGAARVDRRQQGRGPRVAARARAATARPGCRPRSIASSLRVAGSRPGTARAASRSPAAMPSTRRGPRMLAAGGQHGVGRIAGGTGGLGRGQDRVAVQVDVGGDGDVGQRVVVRAVALAQHREAQIGLRTAAGRRRASTTPCRLVTCVAGSITVAPDASFIDWRMKTAPTCRRSSLICPS